MQPCVDSFFMEAAARMKKIFAVLLVLALIFCSTGCAAEYRKYSNTYLGVFDTEIIIMGYATSQAAFDEVADEAIALLKEYNQIFDAYNSYPGLNNLWYINRYAGQAPVEIPKPLYDLIAWCKGMWDGGRQETNIAMGAVLSIWHDYRTAGLENPANAVLPPMDQLLEARLHTDMADVILDEEKCTVYFADPLLRLDIGAVAKGWAADALQEYLSAKMPSFLLSLGGNVLSGEAPMDGRRHWGVSVQDPDAENLLFSNDILDVLYVDQLSVVTSGDYWRYYTVDGKKYHHIIDSKTLMPAEYIQAVTVVCPSSLMADFLTTTLFVMPYEEGLRLIESIPDAEALWSLMDGTVKMSSGMSAYAKSLGATAYD